MTQVAPNTSSALGFLRSAAQRFAPAAERLGALVWWHLAVLSVLRAAWLLRPDPFGQPLVGKFDWYWFHAVALDAQQALQLTKPAWLALAAAALVGPAALAVVQRWVVGLTILACTLVVFAQQVDLEVMRFVGTHLSLTLITTYTNGELLRQLPRLLSGDAGGPFVGAFLLVAGVGAQLYLQLRTLRRQVAAGRAVPVVSLAFFALCGAGLLLDNLWGGLARTWRLRGVVAVLERELSAPTEPPLSAALQRKAQSAQAERLRLGRPDLQQYFVDPQYPLLHLTAWQACATGRAPPQVDCAADTDGDGAPQQRDCNNRDATVHPGATDLPGDGIDQDCSGDDAQPWNFLVIVMESQRAMSVGHVPGAQSWSPRLDGLARQGLAQARAVAASLPTIGSFMAIHTGLFACAGCQIATDYATARLPAFPAALRSHGYYARFFSAFDPAWDNQSAWLRHWYDDVDYDRSREEDVELMDHVAQWMHSELAGKRGARPFLVTVTTRTNHFPFPRVAGVPSTGDDSWPARMKDTMGYADAAVGSLLDRLASEPWMAHTVVVVTGDHGYPLGEHGAFHLYQTVHVEATGVPLVLVGGHPLLAPLRGQLGQEPCSHVDLAPTLMDLAGIDPSGVWQGRSLLRPGKGFSASYKERHEAIEAADRRVLFDRGADAQPTQLAAYNRLVDPRESHPLPVTAQERALAEEGELLSSWMRTLYAADRILPSR